MSIDKGAGMRLTGDGNGRGIALGDNGESTRERIVRTAAELFAANGYDATGIAEIQAQAEISRGAFYYHIDSKQTLLFEISKNQVDNMNAVAAGIVVREEPADVKIGEMARSLLRNISDHRAEWAVFFREFVALKGERRAEILAARDMYECYWIELFEAGAREGALTEVTALQVKGILGMLNYTYLWLDPHGSVSPEELADSFVNLLLNGLRIERSGP
ncbi:MAG: TetR family transcriptional regulator [Streptosporangiaceae bacterium]